MVFISNRLQSTATIFSYFDKTYMPICKIYIGPYQVYGADAWTHGDEDIAKGGGG